MDARIEAPPPRAVWAGRVLLAAVFCAIALLLVFPLVEFDTFWHLAYGRAMVAAGAVIQREILSYTNAGHPLSNHAWLAQLVLYGAWRAGGANALIAFRILAGLGVAGLLVWSGRRLGAHPLITALLTLWGFAAVLVRFSPRPQLFSFLGLALLGGVLYPYRSRPARHVIWTLPLLLCIWDTLHGAVQGAILVAAFVGAESLKPLLARTAGDRPWWTPLPRADRRRLLAAAGLTILAMALSPWGLRAWGFFADYLHNDTTTRMLEEWNPTPFAGMELFWAFFAACALVLALRWRALDLSQLAVLLPFTFLAFRYRRAVAPFAIVALPVVAAQATALLAALGRRFPALARARLAAAAVAVGLGWAALLPVKLGQRDPESRWFGYELGLGLHPLSFPAGAARFVRETGLRGNLFHTDKFAGYLAFELGPERKIFHFLHHQLPNVLADFEHEPAARLRWDIAYAVLGREDEMLLFLREGYVPVYVDPVSAVVVRPGAPNQAVLDQYRVQVFRALASDEELLAMGEGPEFPELFRELAQHLAFRADPRLAQVLARLAARPDPRLAPAARLALLEPALRNNPGSAPLAAVTAAVRAGRGAALTAR